LTFNFIIMDTYHLMAFAIIVVAVFFLIKFIF